MLLIRYSPLKSPSSLALVALFYARGALAQLPEPSAVNPPAPARHESGAATGQSLFEEGKALYEAGDLEAACEKFATSHRIEPTTVALLGLATCHRDQGKLGTAWSEYLESQARAQREEDSELEDYAKRCMRELQPRLSTLTIEVSPEVAEIPGLSVRLDGAAFAPEAWNRVRAYDGGQHTIDATATGRDPWRMSVMLRQEADTVRVPIPVLERVETEVTPPVEASPTPPAAPPVQARETSNPWGALEWWGIASAGGGLSAFIASLALRNSARANNDEGTNDAAQALQPVAVGLGALGVTLFIIGRASEGDAPSPQLSLSLQAPTAGIWRANLYGTF